MAKELALGLVIGGAVNKSVGAAFNHVEGRVKRLESTAAKARVLQSMIGETKKLQDEWRKAHASGASAAEGLRRKLDTNLQSLRRQGVEVHNLGRAYEQMGRKARAADLRATGHAQLKQGVVGLRNTAAATAGAAATTMIAPSKVSADYGAVVRDIAIKAGIANTTEEKRMSNSIIDTSRSTGMARNDVADVVNALVGAGMELEQAIQYAPVASKFVVGQGAEATDTARMINALGQNAKITDPQEMQKALEAIAFQGQAGSFEAADMAKWFPQLLAGMEKLGINGNDAVSQLGSMLQVQMKTAGSSDEAANNLKNWMEKIGSTDVVKSYKDAGIDYQASLNTGLQKGMSTLEASFALAQKYVEATDPKKATEMSEAMAKISKEADPAKAKKMMASLEQALRTGDLFADMQVKAALTAYTQNKDLYQQLKKDSANASGILDKNLAERRETSAQKWSEAGQAMNDALRSAGDAMRPLTDKLAGGVSDIGKSLSSLSDSTPNLVTGLLSVGAAVATITAAYSGLKIAKGLMNIGRGTLMGNPNLVQKVHVVNGLGGAGGLDVNGDGGKKAGRRAKRRGGFWRRRGAVGGPVALEPVSKPRMRVYPGGTAVEAPKSLSGWKPPTEVPKTSTIPASSLVAASNKVGGALSVVRSVGKANVAGALLDAALSAKEVYDTAETRDEKAQGYGSVAGTATGALAGAAAGAAIGSVVPVIGTAIGGLIGAWLGSQGGGKLGGVVGKALFGGPDEPASATAKSAPDEVARSLREADTKPQAAMLAEAAKAVPGPKPEQAKVDQKITLSPSFSIIVQGDAKDPRELLNQMMPEIERRLSDLSQQVARRDMTDAPVF
jgi:TP901 family phage tail tape measure protein